MSRERTRGQQFLGPRQLTGTAEPAAKESDSYRRVFRVRREEQGGAVSAVRGLTGEAVLLRPLLLLCWVRSSFFSSRPHSQAAGLWAHLPPPASGTPLNLTDQGSVKLQIPLSLSGPQRDRREKAQTLVRQFRNYPRSRPPSPSRCVSPGTFCPEHGALGCRGRGCCPAGLRLQNTLYPPPASAASRVPSQLRIFLRKQSGPQPQDLCACFASCSGYLASRPRLLLFLFAYETLG